MYSSLIPRLPRPFSPQHLNLRLYTYDDIVWLTRDYLFSAQRNNKCICLSVSEFIHINMWFLIIWVEIMRIVYWTRSDINSWPIPNCIFVIVIELFFLFDWFLICDQRCRGHYIFISFMEVDTYISGKFCTIQFTIICILNLGCMNRLEINVCFKFAMCPIGGSRYFSIIL